MQNSHMQTNAHKHKDLPAQTAEVHMLKRRKKAISQDLAAEIHLVCVSAMFVTNLSSEHM